MTEEKKPDPIDIHVGNRMRLRRNLLKMSQAKLAEELGVTFQQIQKYEKGTNRMGSSRLYRIAHILDSQIEYFFEDLQLDDLKKSENDNSNNAQKLVKFTSTPESVDLNQCFMDIQDATIRSKLLQLVKAITRADSARE